MAASAISGRQGLSTSLLEPLGGSSRLRARGGERRGRGDIRLQGRERAQCSQDPNDWGLILQIWRRRCVLSLWPPHPLQPTAVNRWTDPSLGLSRALQRLPGGREGEEGQTQLHLPSLSPPPSKAGRPSSLRPSSLLPVVRGTPHEA